MTQRLSLMQRFGRLRVLIPKGRVRRPDGAYKKRKAALCICDCGKWVSVQPYKLLSGSTKSCGCWRSEKSGKRGKEQLFKHGQSNSPEYISWAAAKSRCQNPNSFSYPHYGGRGITFHPAWEDFAQFLADVGLKPSPEHTLDRYPDNDGNYEPGNVRWGNLEQQHNNRRDNVYVLLEGERMSLTQAARKLDFNAKTASNRRHAGWPPSRWFSPVAEVQLVS